MANRAQRRAAAKKRPGETYADVLAKKKMIKEAVDKSVHDTSVAIEADIKTQRAMWMALEALNRAFGFGGVRARRFMVYLEEVANEFEESVKKNGADYAKEDLRRRVAQILETEVVPIWEEEIAQARRENEAAGVYFSGDDLDKTESGLLEED